MFLLLRLFPPCSPSLHLPLPLASPPLQTSVVFAKPPLGPGGPLATGIQLGMDRVLTALLGEGLLGVGLHLRAIVLLMAVGIARPTRGTALASIGGGRELSIPMSRGPQLAVLQAVQGPLAMHLLLLLLGLSWILR